MLGIIFIIALPFVLYVVYYRKCVKVGNDVSEVNAEINELSLPKKPDKRVIGGTDIDKQYDLIDQYLKFKYPKMYYFSLKNCKVYSTYITVEMLMEDDEIPHIESFNMTDIVKSSTLSVDGWIERLRAKLDEYKENALSEGKVFFTIPWDKELANDEFQEKVVSWFESHTLYRVAPGDDGLIFNFQDEMF